MVTRTLFMALLALFATSLATAGSNCTSGTEFEPPLCPLHLPKIAKVTILTNAAKSPAETDSSVSCSNFVINHSQVRRFLARAKTTTPREAHYTLDWSPCYATGEVFFKDGRKGRWSVDQFRAGSLKIDESDELTLYCPTCRFKPFLW